MGAKLDRPGRRSAVSVCGNDGAAGGGAHGRQQLAGFFAPITARIQVMYEVICVRRMGLTVGLSAWWECWNARWWRPLLPSEQAFVQAWFGAEQGQWLVQRIRLGQRRMGDTRRALCCNGGWMSFPQAMYMAGDNAQPLRLEHPLVAGVFAHELLHELQRRKGLPVTRQALVLQCQWLLLRRDPYRYSNCRNAGALLRQFWRANVEQQGQMWQDCVQAHVAGHPLPSHALLGAAVQQGRLRHRHACGGH